MKDIGVGFAKDMLTTADGRRTLRTVFGARFGKKDAVTSNRALDRLGHCQLLRARAPARQHRGAGAVGGK